MISTEEALSMLKGWEGVWQGVGVTIPLGQCVWRAKMHVYYIITTMYYAYLKQQQNSVLPSKSLFFRLFPLTLRM